MTAIVVVSTSEIQKVIPHFTSNFEITHPDEFKKILWNLGLNINSTYERQEGFEHRNRFNEVVNCTRWVGLERLDEEWTKSGYASREARNDSSGSKLLKDLDKFRYEKIED